MHPQQTTIELRIREKARQLFRQKGYEDTHLRDIAEAAGVGASMINYYFRTKLNLYKLIAEDAPSS